MRLELLVETFKALLKDVYGDSAFCSCYLDEDTGLYKLRFGYDGKYYEFLEIESVDFLEPMVDFLHEAKIKGELLKTCRDTLFGKNS